MFSLDDPASFIAPLAARGAHGDPRARVQGDHPGVRTRPTTLTTTGR